LITFNVLNSRVFVLEGSPHTYKGIVVPGPISFILFTVKCLLDYNDKRLTNDRPDLLSESQDSNLKKKKKISHQKSEIGLDTKTY
jgi:hypothetical protein